ncbi:MAG: CsiV family protein [Pseudomonadales bacterium]
MGSLSAEATESVKPEETEEILWHEDYYDGWYQIEVIAFAHRSSPVSDEMWPLAEPAYPDSMVEIAPRRDEDIRPSTLSQVDDLLAYEKLWSGREDQGREREADFMFEDRSRFSRDPVLADMTNPASRQKDADNKERSVAPVIPDNLFRNDAPEAFREISNSDFELAGVAGSLRRSSNYRVLKHIAWRQPLNETKYPVLLQAGERYDGIYELDGTLTVTRSRFLHLATDLWFTEFSPRRDSRQFGRREDPELANLDPEIRSRFPQLVAWAEQRGTRAPIHMHPLVQSRRMRSNNVHFIDHPFFGLIVKVTEFTYEPTLPGTDR